MKFQRKDIKRYIKSWVISKAGFLIGIKTSKSKFRGIVNPGEKSLILNSYLSGKISTGEWCRIFDSSLVGEIEIGRYSSINGPNTDIFAKINKVVIGSFSSIARNATFQEYNHKMERITTSLIGKNVFNLDMETDIVSKGGISIGSDVWIGNRVTILSGASIGHGAVVAANSLVNSNIPPYAVAAGSPAKVIKYRFTDEIIVRLLDIKWWDWPIEKIIKNKNLFLKDQLSIDDLENIE